MKRFLTALMALIFATAAVAQDWPATIGTIPNRAGGTIVFSGEECPTNKERRFAYVREEGGRVTVTGCWVWRNKALWVYWDNGEIFNYSLDSFEMSPEFRRHLEHAGTGT